MQGQAVPSAAGLRRRTWWRLSGTDRRRRRSTTGSTKASVLPEPVAASTDTSLCPQKSGMTASCGSAEVRERLCGGQGGLHIAEAPAQKLLNRSLTQIIN